MSYLNACNSTTKNIYTVDVPTPRSTIHWDPIDQQVTNLPIYDSSYDHTPQHNVIPVPLLVSPYTICPAIQAIYLASHPVRHIFCHVSQSWSHCS